LAKIRVEIRKLNCNTPVGCCCHQFKNWWLPKLNESPLSAPPNRRQKP